MNKLNNFLDLLSIVCLILSLIWLILGTVLQHNYRNSIEEQVNTIHGYKTNYMKYHSFLAFIVIISICWLLS